MRNGRHRASRRIPAHGEIQTGYRDYDVQEFKAGTGTISASAWRSMCGEGWQHPGGQVPPEYRQGHYGPLLVGYILYQHYQCRVPQPLIHEQLREWGIDISTGQLHRLLCEHQETFQAEQQQVLRVGLETATLCPHR